MKLKNLLMAGLPLAMALASCSSDEPNKTGVENNTFIGDGYMAVSIALPQTSGTRAANDNFNDGLADEYKINNAAIVLFKGVPTDNETSYTFQGAYDITPTSSTPGDETVTVQLARTFRVNSVTLDNTKGEKIFALALVNYTGRVTITGNGLTVGSTDMTNKTFGDLLKETSNNNFVGDNKNDFFMTNAVMSNTAGGANSPLTNSKASIFTLVQCADECIFEDEGKAQQNPACTINVERAVAKATLHAENPTVTIINGDGTEGASLVVTEVKWVLDNTEPSSFVVRNMGEKAADNTHPYNTYLGYKNDDCASEVTTGPYRMVGALQSSKLQEKARTYWCYDPQYDKDATLTTGAPTNDNAWGLTGDNHPQYCHENTFTAEYQTWKNTTRAVLKVTYKYKANSSATAEEKDIYVTNGVNSVYYVDADQTGIKSAFLGNTELIDAYHQYAGTGTHDMGTDFTFTYEDKDNVLKIKSIKVSTKINGATEAKEVTLYTAAVEASGDQEAKDAVYGELKRKANDTDESETVYFASSKVQNLVTAVESAVNVDIYKNGVAYYQVRIKHFGDNLTPWNTTQHPVKLTADYTTKEAYGFVTAGTTPSAVNEDAFLGRYGMVRNNWYDVTIDGFKRMGSNTFPSVSDDTTPDDVPEEQFMSMRINVLSWAKRTQNEKL